jgi:hypothetical protein
MERFRRDDSFAPQLLANVVGFVLGASAFIVHDHFERRAFWEQNPGRHLSMQTPAMYFGPYAVTIKEHEPHKAAPEP